MLLVDLHTHHLRNEKNIFAIVNLHDNFESRVPDSFYSAGLHPWFIDKGTMDAELEKLAIVASEKNVLAIGECGLDRVCKTEMQLQEYCFIRQIHLAKNLRRPLIIHCVRAYREVCDILKTTNIDVPVIFHGFNKNLDVARQILSCGYYLSFGKSLFDSKLNEVFLSVPDNQYFLESDDGGFVIEAVYEKAAEIRRVSLKELSRQVCSNVNAIFEENILSYE